MRGKDSSSSAVALKPVAELKNSELLSELISFVREATRIDMDTSPNKKSWDMDRFLALKEEVGNRMDS